MNVPHTILFTVGIVVMWWVLVQIVAAMASTQVAVPAVTLATLAILLARLSERRRRG